MSLVMRGRRGAFPLGILIVNVTGSFALGVVTGLGAAIGGADSRWIIGVGLLGGYTTFSTVSVETVLLGAARASATGRWTNALGTSGLGARRGALLGRLSPDGCRSDSRLVAG